MLEHFRVFWTCWRSLRLSP